MGKWKLNTRCLLIERIKKQWDDEPYMQQLHVLPYVVYTAEIDAFKDKYLGKELFAKFSVKDKKFQKVIVVQVGAGDARQPIRVIVETISGDKEQQDICTCGTNVPYTFVELNGFDNSFQMENPKDKFKGSDEIWDLICQSKIRIGMTEEELRLSWGSPKKINETTVSGKASKQFVYYDQYVYVDNGLVTSFQSSK
jgi:hypothetical protein